MLLALVMAGGLAYGSFVAVDSLGMVPNYKSPKDRARAEMEAEREAITAAKQAAPELYPEPVEFYLKDFIEAYEKAKD